MSLHKRLCSSTSLTLAAGFLALAAAPAQAVFFHVGNGSIDGSLCVGNDCVSSESFGFDTLRLKENNLRLHFDDTSTAASFPDNDWRLYANDSANGGAEYFGIEDASAGRFVFRVFAGARANALVIDSQGDLGLGTTTPAADIDIKTGNTPTVRLQQDGSSGFAPQTWDLAGNEASFFIRDATNGSTLPFRVFPSAPSNALTIEGSTGDIGIGTTSPDAPLDIENSDSFVFMRLTAATAAPNIAADITFTDAGAEGELRFNIENAAGNEAGGPEMTLDAAGNMTIDGEITTSGSCAGGCDLVFAPDHERMPLERHAALMWDRGYLPNVGPTPENGPFNLSTKVGGMLNELEYAHVYIAELHRQVQAQGAEIEALKALVAAR